MEIISADRFDDEDFSKQLSKLIISGAIFCYPTDTCYALGANALNEEAAYKIYIIKGRDLSKPLPVIVRDIPTAERFCVIDNKARALLKAFPGISLVVPKKCIPSIINPSKIMVRMPDNKVVRAMLANVPVPVISTSANKSDDPNPYEVKDIVRSFSGSLSYIHFAIDAGKLKEEKPSTIMDCIEGKVYRVGKYSEEEVMEVYNAAD
ncbi:MAG: L-threonylcarbamoyladenylate synthase [Candidatus Methanofastidiosia archaeon]